jgi:hypothetical protein
MDNDLLFVIFKNSYEWFEKRHSNLVFNDINQILQQSQMFP